MLYQIKVTDRQKEDEQKESVIVLKPHITIKDAAYWQKRMIVLLPRHRVTCQVASK